MRSDGSSHRAANALLAVAVVVSLLICAGLLVYGSGRGFDLTDEVFYLLRTRDPDAYDLSYQPFGYLLRPFFRLTGGDLQLYRLAGFAITAAAGAFLGQALPWARPRRALFGLYGAVAGLTIFFPWIVTPSYNSAANVGALLVLGGALQALDAAPTRRIAGALAAGAGLCLAAFGKPPLFAIAVLGLIATVLVARRARTPLLASLALGAALMSLVLPPAEIAALVGRIGASQHILGLPNTPLALPAKVLRDGLAAPPLLIAAALAAGLGLLVPSRRAATWLGYAAIALSLCHVPSLVGDILDGAIPDFIGLALLATAAGYAGVVRSPRPADRLLIAVLLAAPLAVALGTFNNQWFQLNFSMAFAFLALFALASSDPSRWRRGAAQALATAGPAAVMLLAAVLPYSLPASIFDQQVPVQAPLVSGTVRVDRETAAFLRAAHGLAPGALVIDLSGTGPGVAAALGAQAPVLPWLNPATPTWPDVVWARLSPAQRDTAAFVVPVWPAFAKTAPARWLTAHQGRFCRTPLPSMTFWGEDRSLELWRPYSESPISSGALPSFSACRAPARIPGRA